MLAAGFKPANDRIPKTIFAKQSKNLHHEGV